MVSLASLLNPAGPGPASASHFRSAITPRSSSPCLSSYTEGSPFLPTSRYPPAHRQQKMVKGHAGYSKCKAKGIVNFPPFEDLDDASMRDVLQYHVSPFENIHTNCRHIPYNSGKKDFFEKTGRESFEVFQYTFQVPNDDTEYTVMWDYNVGLVRMTPFFKCCNYPKTTPAKMLNMNPGLRDITHSITGGSIMAQGYWMPFACAKAVCATFCHHISGALIPIFGPRFPDLCIPPHSPDHGRMCIDPAIIAESTQEAERFRKIYAEQSSTALAASHRTIPPRRNNTLHPRDAMGYDHSSSPYGCQRFRNGRGLDSPYGTDTDDNDIHSGPDAGCGDVNIRDFGHHRYPYTPPVPSMRLVHANAAPSSGWKPHNLHQVQSHHRQPSIHHHQPPTPNHHEQNHARYILNDTHPHQPHREQRYHNANPWLSAVPRPSGHIPPHNTPSRPLPPVRHFQTISHPPSMTSSATFPLTASSKRPRITANYPETDHEYDGGESQSSSPTNPVARILGGSSLSRPSSNHRQLPLPGVPSTTAERNAAMLLMNLSMTERDGEMADGSKDGKGGTTGKLRATPEIGSLKREFWDNEGRSKRKRATSM